MFKKILLLITGIGAFGFIACYFIGIPFLNIIYNTDFSNYKSELMIIVIGAVFYSISMICSSFLTSIRKISIQLYLNIIFAIVALIISALLVKYYGILGGTLAYLIIMAIRMTIYLIITFRSCKD